MNTISITLNGERRKVPEGTNIADLLELAGTGDRKVAVVLNETIIRQADQATTPLAENDQVDVLAFAGGG